MSEHTPTPAWKIDKYKRGEYTFAPPDSVYNLWSMYDWIRWIDLTGGWTGDNYADTTE